jgi:hypothetical protein
MKKSKYSSPYYAKEYFSKDILPSDVYAGQKIIRQPVPYRRHEDIEFMLVRSGSGTVTVNARSYPVSRGSLLCFSPSHFHKIDPHKGSRLEMLECHMNPGVYLYITACPYYHPSANHLPTPPVLARLDEAETVRTEHLLDELATVISRAPITENQPAFFLLMKLFGLLETYAVTSETCSSLTDTL